jgi:heat shock protein HslJ
MKQYAKILILLLSVVSLFMACSSAPKFSDVKDKDWYLVEVRMSPKNIDFDRSKLVEEGYEDIFSLRFDVERANGVGAPNHYFAPYKLAGKQGITINAIAQTQMAPLREPEKLKEHDFFTYLQKTDKWNLEKGNLELYSQGEDGKEAVLVFTPAGKGGK